MSFESDRNPSPPAEVLQSFENLVPDRIGETVFSKHWVFQILIDIIEAVNKVCKENELTSCKATDIEDRNPEQPSVIELDQKLEDEACTLWDMSANNDVAHFLHEFKAAEIFLEVIEKTKSPRLLEIVVGILGNIASFPDICEAISKNGVLVNSIILLSGSSDAPTVIQVLRLIHSGIVNKKVSELWLEVIKKNPTFMESFKFIFKNSLNGEVIKGGFQLLYYILDKEDYTCTKWGKDDYLKSVIEAGRQLHSLKDYEALDELWLVLNLLCQHEESIRSLAELFTDVNSLFYGYVMKFSENEDVLPPAHRIAATAAAFSTFILLLQCENVDDTIVEKDNAFLTCLQKMLVSVNEKLLKKSIKEPGSSTCTDHKVFKTEKNHTKENTEKTPKTGGDSPVPTTDSVDDDDSAHCSDKYDNKNKNLRISSLAKLERVFEEDYDTLNILKESLSALCSLITSSMNQEDDMRRMLTEVLENCKANIKSLNNSPSGKNENVLSSSE